MLFRSVTELFDKISALIEEARQRVSTTVNIAEVYTKYNVGRYIVEDEQKGNYRAEYGKQVIKLLSKKLEDKFGDGWSAKISNLGEGAEPLKLVVLPFFILYI